MIGSLATLLLFQLTGVVLVRLTGVPLPGPVLGMILLFIALLLRGHTPEVFASNSRGLLNHLALLFVPAGVGIITHLHRVADEWLALSITLVASTVLCLVAAAFTLHVLTRHRQS